MSPEEVANLERLEVAAIERADEVSRHLPFV
jgi:hypothetical protein